MLEDLNGGIGDRVRVIITGAFGVPGENLNGKRVVEFCLHKYTWVARGQDGVEVKIMIDMVLVKKDMRHFRSPSCTV